MDAIITIEHSGTNTLFRIYGEIQYYHTHKEYDLTQFQRVHTTYRDPLRVGASWANRYTNCLTDPTNPRYDLREKWKKEWIGWGKLMDEDNVIVHNVENLPYKENRFKDRYGLHAALNAGDMGHYYKYVPKCLIDFANNIVMRVM